MKLIVGLGNPGDSYETTRHNVGFMVLDKLANELASHALTFTTQEKFQALVAGVADIVLIKPLTFMNASGESVQHIMKYYKAEASDILVIHDDIDLPLGKLRIRDHGASGGHNGVQSIIDSLKTDAFVRIRLGIGRSVENAEGYDVDVKRHMTKKHVLTAFHESEAGDVRKLIKHAVEATRTVLDKGIDKAMNLYN